MPDKDTIRLISQVAERAKLKAKEETKEELFVEGLLLDAIYPIGSIYMSLTQNEETEDIDGKEGCPIAELGGTWERIEDIYIPGSWIDQTLSSSKDYIKMGDYRQYMGKTFDIAYTKQSNVYSGKMTLYPTYENFYYVYMDTDPDLLVRFSIGTDYNGYFRALKWNSGWVDVQEGQLSVRLVDETLIYRWKRVPDDDSE